MNSFIVERQYVSLHAPNLEPQLFTSTPSPVRGRRYARLHRPLVAHRSHWCPSAIWTGTTTWCPGTVPLPSKIPSPALVVRTTICISSPRRLFQRQRRRLTESLVGGELPDTLWPGCLRYMPSTRRTCFPVWGACPVLSGFPE